MLKEWNKIDISNWLVSIDMEQYVNNFIENGIDKGSILLDTTYEKLVDISVNIVGHRLKILNNLYLLKRDNGFEVSNDLRTVNYDEAIQRRIASQGIIFSNADKLIEGLKSELEMLKKEFLFLQKTATTKSASMNLNQSTSSPARQNELEHSDIIIPSRSDNTIPKTTLSIITGLNSFF